MKTNDGAKSAKLASGLSSIVPTGIGTKIDVKGTASEDNFSIDAGEFGEVEIGAFLTALEAR